MKRVYTLMFFTCVILIAVLFSAGQDDKVETISVDNVIRNGDTNSDKLAFACNVDWGSEILPAMFKVLDENNIKITFFVSGNWAKKNPDLLREMYLRGHDIGNHGYYHKLCSQIEENQIREEIINTENVVRELTGIKTDLFAPPSGDYDERTVEICEELGYKLILWSTDTIDWKPDSTSDKIKKRVMAKPLKGSIVLMHPKSETVKALPDIIKYIHSKEVEIVPVDQLIND